MNWEAFAAVKHYLDHWVKSFHLHGIHSPFVFEFEKKCLRDALPHVDYFELSRFRESVTHNPQLLTVEDHGAGSKIFKTPTRSTQDLLKHNSSDQKTAELFYRIATYFKPRRILELGTSLGIATHALAMARPDALLHTVEGSKMVADYSRATFKGQALSNVAVVCGTFQEFLNSELHEKPHDSYDLIYLDGHHDGAATLNYFEQLLAHAHNDTVFILDDIYWSRDMTAAWNTLCNHKKVTASIDLFDVGLLFLRKEQRQQRFYIRL
jgi:predicted O-methyltransferase YrrM